MKEFGTYLVVGVRLRLSVGLGPWTRGSAPAVARALLLGTAGAAVPLVAALVAALALFVLAAAAAVVRPPGAAAGTAAVVPDDKTITTTSQIAIKYVFIV